MITVHSYLVVGMGILTVCSLAVMSVAQDSEMLQPLPINDLTLTVVFDNYQHNTACEASWGFACIVEGPERTILFDTGADGDILLNNMRTLGIVPSSIDMIVLSHAHWDHVDGLSSFLSANSNVSVVMPQSFPQELKAMVTGSGATLVPVEDPATICEHVYSTGELGSAIIEKAMIIETDKGLVVITGCAHPGIIHMLDAISHQHSQPIHFVLGGFHLNSTPEPEVRTIIGEFISRGVRYAGATHCTGEEACQLFAEAYKDRYITAGVGRIISGNDLP